MSPGDLGELLESFVFLDIFSLSAKGGKSTFGMHPHSGVATITFMIQGHIAYKDTTGATGVLLAWTPAILTRSQSELRRVDSAPSRTSFWQQSKSIQLAESAQSSIWWCYADEVLRQ